MSENVELKTKDAVTVWDNLSEVRQQFAPTLTDKEFAFFVTLGKSLNANPFKREIWAVKYDQKAPASIFLGRDMYRRRAQEQPEYDGHVADAVYSNDKFVVENGVPKHSYSLADRGTLLGAYCVVYKKTQSHPFFVFVKLSEYNKGFALWKTMPETLIKKVSEAQCLRGAFQGIFAGTYDESENWITTDTHTASKANVIAPPMRQSVEEKKFENVITVTASDEPEPEPPPQEQGNPATDNEPPTDFKLGGEEQEDNSLDGLKAKIRKDAARHFPNENSFALWLKTLTASEDGKYKGIESISIVKSEKQARFILGALRKKIADKANA